MSIFIRILLVVGAIVLLAFMLRKIRLAKLKIEYTVFWIGFSCILVINVFPLHPYAASETAPQEIPQRKIYFADYFFRLTSAERKCYSRHNLITGNEKKSKQNECQRELPQGERKYRKFAEHGL